LQHVDSTGSVNHKDTTHVLEVEVIAAADLRQDFPLKIFATCDSYCIVAVGGVDEPFREKCPLGKATTRIDAGKRHPRWAGLLTLPIQGLPASPEATLRAMAKGTPGDVPLGEVRLDLVAGPAGAGCFRLLGGGFASFSLRWALRRAEEHRKGSQPLPRGSPAFEKALAFWVASEGKWVKDNWAKLFEKGNELEAIALAFTEELQGADAGYRNELLMQAPLAAMLGAENKGSAALLEVLGGSLSQLLVPTRARVAGALVERLSFGIVAQGGQQLLVDLFRTATGARLLELKRLIATGGVGLDMVVLYESITDKAIQESLVAHLNAESQRMREPQVASCGWFWCSAKPSQIQAPLHILSDIDMTFWVGKFGTGGPKFPPGMIPGVRPLLRALGGQVTFLSARPGLVENKTRQELMEAGAVEVGLLKGSLAAVLMAPILKGQAHAAMGERKSQAFMEHAALFPESRFVFFGDTGEGDVDFATGGFTASEDSLALIHDIVAEDGVTAKTPASRREELGSSGVVIFDCYAGAALALFRKGLLTARGLRAAAQGCHDELLKIEPERFARKEVHRARWTELARDLDRVDAALKQAGVNAVERNVPAADA